MNSLKWIKNILILVLSLFFLIIGINTLIGSYRSNNPMDFVIVFFFLFAFNFSMPCWNYILFFPFPYQKQPEGINNDEAQ